MMVSRARILVVEDEAIIAMDIERRLIGLGYEVPAVAHSGEDAIAAAAEHRPDLVLTDIRLEGARLNGIQAAAEIWRLYRIPFVYLTAFADDETLREAGVTDPFGYILKPFSERELHVGVEMALHSHRIQRERDAQADAARQFETSYREIFEAASEGIFLIDLDTTKVLDMNRHACELFGYERSEMSSLDLASLAAEHGGEAEARLRKLKETSATGPQVFEWLCRDKRGRAFWTEASLKIAVIAGKRRLLATARDIQDAKESQELLKKTREQLYQSQKLDSIGQLAGGIAHDFNNLLACILGYADVLRWQFEGNPDVVEKLSAIIKSASRGANLTRQLLGFARKGQYRKSRIEGFDAILSELNQILSHSIDKNITIGFQCVSDVWPIEGDATQILQVLMNLGLNARDAMPTGGSLKFEVKNTVLEAAVAAKLGVAGPGNYVCLSASDSGTGIPPEIQEKIFDPFFTTKEVGKGTGLGLATVYGIMKGHGGAVSVYSQPGHGTTFRLYFPASQAGETASLEGNREAAPGKIDLRSHAILIADDEEALRSLAGEILRVLGARVFFAEDGKQALEVFETHRDEISRVVLDIGMPKLGGLAVFRAMRKINPGLKVVFASGYTAENEEIAKLLHEQNVDFIEKPFERSTLIQKLA